MREITRSVKVALKCLIAVVLVDVDLPYWTSKGSAFSRIYGHFQQHLYCTCAKMVIYELPM